MSEEMREGLQQEQPSAEEVRLTEDGGIEFVEQSQEDVGETQGSVEETQGETRYTPEEIERDGIDKLDPNKLPPELLPFYKSMQADYTRKTQALAEERKAIERVLDKALSHPELAREFMSDPELVGLVQRHPELAQKFQAVSQMAQPQEDFFDSIAEQAKQLVEQQLGEEFDEFNPKHLAAFNLAVQQIQSQVQAQQAIQSKLLELQQKEPHFAEIDRYAEEKLFQMPYAEAIKIINAFQTGDLDTALAFWEQCRKEWYEKNLNQTQSQAKPQPQPVKVESAGTGQAQTQPHIDPKMIANLSPDEQEQLLIKLGLV